MRTSLGCEQQGKAQHLRALVTCYIKALPAWIGQMDLRAHMGHQAKLKTCKCQDESALVWSLTSLSHRLLIICVHGTETAPIMRSSFPAKCQPLPALPTFEHTTSIQQPVNPFPCHYLLLRPCPLLVVAAQLLPARRI